MRERFESIAKTNTTHTNVTRNICTRMFESIAKTNTTHTQRGGYCLWISLRVLLKQIQDTNSDQSIDRVYKL